MLFVRETHHVIGRHAHDFESTYRNEWLPALAVDDDARLLWYSNHAHLTCFAYYVFTITALRDGNAWEHLAQRVHSGDLREPARKLDGLRHDVEAQILRPAPWSPLTHLDLATVPATETDHESALFVEDTFRTNEPIDELAARDLERGGHSGAGASPLTEIVGCLLAVAPWTGGDDVVLWQRVRRPELLLPSLMAGSDERAGSPGIERVDSTLQRVSSWSPLA